MDIALVLVKDDGSSKEFPVPSLPATIGRGEDVKIRIPLSAVSRTHCELIEDDEELVVRDMRSSNGTFVNQERVDGSRELVPGDLLAIGPLVFVVRIDGFPAEIDALDCFAAGFVAGDDDDGSAPPPPMQSRPRSADDPKTQEVREPPGPSQAQPGLGSILDDEGTGFELDIDLDLPDDEDDSKAS